MCFRNRSPAGARIGLLVDKEQNMKLVGFALPGLIILAIAAVPSLGQIDVENAVGLWLFDEGQGEVVNDLSGNENHGTFNSTPEWAEGVFGGAINCATGGHILIKDSDSLDLTEAWTLTLWVKINPPMERWQTILNKRFDTETNYVIRLNDGGGWEVMVNNGGWVRVRDSSQAKGGEWVHLAGVYNGTDTLSLFVDGEQVASRSGVAPPPANNIDLRLGSYAGSGGGIDGMLDETAIFNVALEAEDIVLIKDEGLAVALGLGGAGQGQAKSPNPKDGAIHEQTWVSLSWRPADSAASHDVYLGEDLAEVEGATEDSDVFRGNQLSATYFVGFPGFDYPDGLTPGKTYYWRIDEINHDDPNSPWKGSVWSFSIPSTTAYNPDPVDGAEFVEDVTLSWASGYGAKVHFVYISDNFDDVNDAAGGASQSDTSYRLSEIEPETIYYWRVDEFDGADTHKGDIWAFTTPGTARSLLPANRATDVGLTQTLNWIPADNAISHNLYFGTDSKAVENATTTSPEYKGNKAPGSETYDPGKMAWNSDYYWRVDAVYSTGTVKGLVWSFTTTDYIVVEDFESYNDVDPPDPNSNRIFDKWIDGYGTTTNGALVGNEFPPYTEQTVVHGGEQSLIYSYDNNLKTSEATLTLLYPRDWTEEGVGRLSLWFRGKSTNAAEQMYVALNGTAVVYHDDPSATQLIAWTEWVIDLQQFADQGVNLTNVNTITIGFGTRNSPAAGGSGTLYFDDIRLYRRKAPRPTS